MFNHALRQLLPEHAWNPGCAQNFSWTHVQSYKTSGQLLRKHTQNPRHLDLHPHTRHRDMFMIHEATRLLRPHATSTLGSLSVRKQTCSCDNTAAFARCEHTCISPCAKRHDPAKRLLRSHATNMFMRQHCCIRTL